MPEQNKKALEKLMSDNTKDEEVVITDNETPKKQSFGGFKRLSASKAAVQ